MFNNKYKKLILTALVGAVVLTSISIGFAAEHEIEPAEKITKDVGTIAYVIATIAAWTLSLVANLIDWAIKFGNDILGLSAVQEGWKIVLQFTNLGFVLGIIIIAFATILRLENYAMKQILWKLIVAALLVNFSLVIAGSFISVSNTTSNFFLEATTSENLSNALANAIQPQAFGEVKEMSLWKLARGGISFFLQYIASLLFIIVFTFLTILAFLTLFVMLLVRAIALAFLLILSPIVWLLWIFPATAQYWQQWWREFIRWNFFAPAVLFFVYLTVLTAGGIKDLSSVKEASGTDAAKAFGETMLLSSNFINHIAQLLILLALLYGGIFVANKFGIAGGNIGVSLAQKVGKGAGAWAGRKGVSLGTRPLRGKWGQAASEYLQERGLHRGKIGRFLTSPLRRLGNVTTDLGTRQGRQLVAQAEKRNEKYSDKELAMRFSTLDRDGQMAAVKRFTKNNTTDLMNVKDRDYFLGSKTTTGKAAAQEMFNRHGEGKAYEDFEKKTGVSHAMASAKTDDARQAAAKAHYAKYKQETWQSVDPNILTDDKYGDLAAYHLVGDSPAALSKLMPKVKTNELDKVKNKIIEAEQKVINNIVESYKDKNRDIVGELNEKIFIINPNITSGEMNKMKDIGSKLEWVQRHDKEEYNKLNDELKIIVSRRKSLNKNLAQRITGGWFTEFEEKEEKT